MECGASHNWTTDITGVQTTTDWTEVGCGVCSWPQLDYRHHWCTDHYRLDRGRLWSVQLATTGLQRQQDVGIRGVSPGGRPSAHLWGLHDGPGVVCSCQQAVSVYERGEPWGSSLGSPLGSP